MNPRTWIKRLSLRRRRALARLRHQRCYARTLLACIELAILDAEYPFVITMEY